MHTQTERVPEHRAALARQLPAAIGLGLYLLTLIVEVLLGASVRWLLVFLGAATLGSIVPLGLSPESCAYAAAFAPLVWSLLGLLSPGTAVVWRRRIGARRPSEEERLAIEDALGQLWALHHRHIGRLRWYLLDDPLPGAAVRGRSLILHRGLLDCGALSAVISHELGHATTLDGPLTEALARLRLRDPLAPRATSRDATSHGGEEPASFPLLLGCLRWLLRLAGGGCAQQLLRPLWAAYWRSREYTADAFAASRGKGTELIDHLRDQELPFDMPQRSFPFNTAQHPPVAMRIERLARNLCFQGGPH